MFILAPLGFQFLVLGSCIYLKLSGESLDGSIGASVILVQTLVDLFAA